MMDMNNNKLEPHTLLKASDVAKRLNIGRSLAYRLMQDGEIPTIRFNRSVRVRPCDLDEFINRCWSGWTEIQES